MVTKGYKGLLGVAGVEKGFRKDKALQRVTSG